MTDSGLEELLQNEMPRRGVLRLFGSLAASILPINAFAADRSHSILYGGWSDDIDETEGYREIIKRKVGPETANDIFLVERAKKAKNEERHFGVVYVRKGDKASAERAAAAHQKAFMEPKRPEQDSLGQTEVVANSEFGFLYNVSFVLGNKLEPAKKIYDLVYRALGQDFGKDLAIEESDKGKFAVIYRKRASHAFIVSRLGGYVKGIAKSVGFTRMKQMGQSLSEDEMIELGKREMKRLGIGAVSRQESGFEIVYDETTYLHEKGKGGAYQQRPEPKAQPKLEPKMVIPKKPEPSKKSPEPKYEKAPEPKEYKTTTANGLTDKIKDMISKVKSSGLRIHGKYVKLPSDSNIALLVYDCEAKKDIVSINADIKMQSASAIKMFVYLGFLLANGKNKIDETTEKALKYMMWKSDNVATNYIMQKTGGPKRVQELIEAYDKEMGKGLSITDYIPLTPKDKLKAQARKIPTSVPNGESFYTNTATARCYSIFLDKLIDGKLPKSDLIRDHMSLPGSDMIYTGVPEIPTGTEVIDKTGRTAKVAANPGAIGAVNSQGQKQWYIIVPIVETKTRQDYLPFVRGARTFIRGLSGITYSDYMKPQYKLK